MRGEDPSLLFLHPLKKTLGTVPAKKRNYLVLLTRRIMPIDRMTAMASNPGVFAFADNPVAYSAVCPGVIVMVVDRSWKPSIFRRRTWVPAGSPGIVAGVMPFSTPST